MAAKPSSRPCCHRKASRPPPVRVRTSVADRNPHLAPTKLPTMIPERATRHALTARSESASSTPWPDAAVPAGRLLRKRCHVCREPIGFGASPPDVVYEGECGHVYHADCLQHDALPPCTCRCNHSVCRSSFRRTDRVRRVLLTWPMVITVQGVIWALSVIAAAAAAALASAVLLVRAIAVIAVVVVAAVVLAPVIIPAVLGVVGVGGGGAVVGALPAPAICC
jgi:hypothetical protein